MPRDAMGRGRATAVILAACLSAFALALPMGDTASAGKVAKKKTHYARSYVLEGRHRSHRRFATQRIPLPVGPAYIYYDYPYYYSRGHYPTHIGGYVYYVPRSTIRCSNRRCAAR